MWSRFAALGAILYLAVFACAAAYPLFDHRTFAGLPAILLGLPWIDYVPSAWFPGGLVADLEELLGRRVQVTTERGLDALLRDRVIGEAIPL